MTNELKIALAQLNPTVGDVNGNRDLIAQARLKAKEQGADLMVASELGLSGYPPEDLVIRPSFQEACKVWLPWGFRSNMTHS